MRASSFDDAIVRFTNAFRFFALPFSEESSKVEKAKVPPFLEGIKAAKMLSGVCSGLEVVIDGQTVVTSKSALSGRGQRRFMLFYKDACLGEIIFGFFLQIIL